MRSSGYRPKTFLELVSTEPIWAQSLMQNMEDRVSCLNLITNTGQGLKHTETPLFASTLLSQSLVKNPPGSDYFADELTSEHTKPQPLPRCH